MLSGLPPLLYTQLFHEFMRCLPHAYVPSLLMCFYSLVSPAHPPACPHDNVQTELCLHKCTPNQALPPLRLSVSCLWRTGVALTPPLHCCLDCPVSLRMARGYLRYTRHGTCFRDDRTEYPSRWHGPLLALLFKAKGVLVTVERVTVIIR
jgi:hypothetical protein